MSLYKDEEEDRKAPAQNSGPIAAEPEHPEQDVEDDEPPSKDDSIWNYFSCAWRDIVPHLFSMVMHLVDLWRDVYFAVKHCRDGHVWYFWFTLAFMIVPAIVTSIVSAKFYWRDRDSPTIAEGKKSQGWRFARRCGLVLFLSPVIRYAESLYYGFLGHKAKSKEDKERAADRMEQEDAVASLLRLVESYLQSALQLVLQIYIRFTSPEDEEVDFLWDVTDCIVLLIVPVLSMAWSLTSYNRILWKTQKDQQLCISSLSSSRLFALHLLFIMSRVIFLSAFASLCTWWVWPACLAHWAIMLIWIILEKRNTCPMKPGEILFDMFISVVQLFTFFDLKTKKTRNLYIYYGICSGEYIVSAVAYYKLFEGDQVQWGSRLPVIFFLSIAINIIFLIGYHRSIRPTESVHRVTITEYDVCPSTDNLAEQGVHVTIRPGSFDVFPDTTERSEESAI